MKKILLSSILLVVKNACQFVKEQVPVLHEDISNIEVISEDSMICDIALSFGLRRVYEAERMYYESKMSRDELEQVLDSMNNELTFVENSWKYGTPETSGDKYKFEWRKVYTVRVTMKSGVTKEPRILMEQDGITPRMLEKDFGKELQRHASELMEVYRRLNYGL